MSKAHKKATCSRTNVGGKNIYEPKLKTFVSDGAGFPKMILREIIPELQVDKFDRLHDGVLEKTHRERIFAGTFQRRIIGVRYDGLLEPQI